MDALTPERDLNRSPLFQVLVDYQQEAPVFSSSGSVQFQELSLPVQMAKYDLTFACIRTAGGNRAKLEYDSGHFEARSILWLAQSLTELYGNLCGTLNSAWLKWISLELMTQRCSTAARREWSCHPISALMN